MKKKIVLLGILFLSVLFFTGCSINKKVIAKEEFKTKMEEKGYSVTDDSEDYADYKQIKSVSVATKDDYRIEFYEFEEVDYSKELYEKAKEELEDENHVAKSTLEVNLGNHQKYEVTGSKKFNIAIRVDKTMIYVTTEEKYKKEIIEVLKEIGYY